MAAYAPTGIELEGHQYLSLKLNYKRSQRIDGISMLVMPHPGGQTVGYSGLEV